MTPSFGRVFFIRFFAALAFDGLTELVEPHKRGTRKFLNMRVEHAHALYLSQENEVRDTNNRFNKDFKREARSGALVLAELLPVLTMLAMASRCPKNTKTMR
jgi:hypothetical protein